MMKYTMNWAGTVKMGPEDARCVVWALGDVGCHYATMVGLRRFTIIINP